MSRARAEKNDEKEQTKQQLTIEEEEQINVLRGVFDMFDEEKKGSITIEEICKVMKNFGTEMTKEEIKEMISGLDEENEGELDFDGFVTFIKRTENMGKTQDDSEDIINAFKAFDRDGSGYLSLDEFRHILTNLGDKFTNEEVNEIFKEADLDGDGKLEYVEFVNYWNSK